MTTEQRLHQLVALMEAQQLELADVANATLSTTASSSASTKSPVENDADYDSQQQSPVDLLAFLNDEEDGATEDIQFDIPMLPFGAPPADWSFE